MMYQNIKQSLCSEQKEFEGAASDFLYPNALSKPKNNGN